MWNMVWKSVDVDTVSLARWCRCEYLTLHHVMGLQKFLFVGMRDCRFSANNNACTYLLCFSKISQWSYQLRFSTSMTLLDSAISVWESATVAAQWGARWAKLKHGNCIQELDTAVLKKEMAVLLLNRGLGDQLICSPWFQHQSGLNRFRGSRNWHRLMWNKVYPPAEGKILIWRHEYSTNISYVKLFHSYVDMNYIQFQYCCKCLGISHQLM